MRRLVTATAHGEIANGVPHELVRIGACCTNEFSLIRRLASATIRGVRVIGITSWLHSVHRVEGRQMQLTRGAMECMAAAGLIDAASIQPRTIGCKGAMIRTLILIILACGVTTFAQAPASQGSSPAFEVVSVERSGPNAEMIPGRFSAGGRWRIQSAPLSLILRAVYGVPRERLIGGPQWIDTERFTVNFKAEGDPTREQMIVMLKSMLADRFNLKVHSEYREFDVYALVLARKGQLGPGLRPASVQCAITIDEAVPTRRQAPRRECGLWIAVINGLNQVRGSNITIDTLLDATGVGDHFTAPVVDRTGLLGKYDIDLDYAPDIIDPASSARGLPLVAAIEVQLGLRFERRKEMLATVVIDSVEMPTPD